MQNDPNDAAENMSSPKQVNDAQPASAPQLSEPIYQEYIHPDTRPSSPETVESAEASTTLPNDAASLEASQTDSVPSTPAPDPATIAHIAQPFQAPANAPAAQAGGQTGYVVPPPGYMPGPVSPGYMAGAPQQGATGYVPVTPQPLPPGALPPGYVPVTLPPGYLPSMSQPQASYPPPVLPPNYVTGPLPPGYLPPMTPVPAPPTQPRKRPNVLAIIGVALAVIVLFSVVLVGLSRYSNQNNPNTTPIAQGTQGAQTTTPSTSPSGHPTSAFQAASCPFPVGAGLTEGQQITCGYVTVPENRAVSNSGKVRLAVAIFRASQYTTTPDPAPVLRLDGGPGGPSLDNFARYITADNYSSFVFDHDQIMFDQRGTGYSTPSLQCKELIQLQYSTSDVGTQSYEQQARACHDRLVSQGIDLNGFNTLQDAADVSDLVHALGYQKMTIYGVSYGTRLALTVMRLYPGVVHASVLDSVYPPNHNRSDLPSDAQRVFDVFFQGCAKDSNCNAKYPNLKTVFYNLVDALNAHPASFKTTDQTTNQSYTEPLSGNDLVSWLFSEFYVTSFIKLLPQAIFDAQNHDYSQISFMCGFTCFDSTFSDGMFYSVECSEDWPFLTQQDITNSQQNITPQIAAVFGAGEQQEYNVCQFWKVQPVPTAQKQSVVSSLPTLVLSGEYDPITPPSNGQETAKNLSNSYFFIFPGQGHGQEYSSGCSDSIINTFEDNPAQKPSDSCISQMSEPAFQ